MFERRKASLAVPSLALLGAASTVAGILAYYSRATAQSRRFPSHLPVLTPAVVASALGLLLLLARSADPGVEPRSIRSPWPASAASSYS